MNAILQPAELSGTIKIIASKSAAHRLLIAAALSDRPTDILCEELSQDIEATAGALNALGASISYEKDSGKFHVIPIKRDGTDLGNTAFCDTASCGTGSQDTASDHMGSCDDKGICTLDVGESGSTLRFLLPVVCALGKDTRIVMHGRLPERPLSPLWEELERHGSRLTRLPDGSVMTSGRLTGGEFTIAANVSSQFISGLLFAIPLLKDPSWIRLTGAVESKGYIRMTIRALGQFGIRTLWEEDILRLVPGDKEGQPEEGHSEGKDGEADPGLSYRSPGELEVEGDWSNAAFWEVAGMLTNGELVCTGLDEDSLQGDRAIRRLKKEIAAGDCIVDARDVPDLVPVMSVLAALSPGTTVFTHAERLRIKESDRIRATVDMLKSLGADASETKDGLIVRGKKRLSGGTVDSCNDHRIAMSAAVASIVCEGEVRILKAEAVRKSYPGFFEDFKKLGGKVTLIEEK